MALNLKDIKDTITEFWDQEGFSNLEKNLKNIYNISPKALFIFCKYICMSPSNALYWGQYDRREQEQSDVSAMMRD